MGSSHHLKGTPHDKTLQHRSHHLLRQPAPPASGICRDDEQGRLQGRQNTHQRGLQIGQSGLQIHEGQCQRHLCRRSQSTGTASDRNNVLVVKAKTAYEVAKERCDDLSGNAKDTCRQEAKTVEKKALAEAKASKETEEAKKNAATEKHDSDYKLAIEKCDALAGDAKASCIAEAKTKFGKK
jgi:hypothetical protein